MLKQSKQSKKYYIKIIDFSMSFTRKEKKYRENEIECKLLGKKVGQLLKDELGISKVLLVDLG